MMESGNWIIAHFNYVPYLDKPILAPLLTASAYSLFGVSDFTTRLVPAIAALLGIFFLRSFALRLFERRTADYAALLLLTTSGYVLAGRFAVIDMLMTLWISLTLFAMFRAFLEKAPRFYLLAYVFMGLATMTKGLIGFVIPGFCFLIFLVWTRNLAELKRMYIPAGILIIAVLFLPWLFAAMKKYEGFFDIFIIDQHFNRFATGSFGRKRPFWFFVPILLLFGLPWALFFPAALKRQFKITDAMEQIKTRFLLSWIAGIMIFFSIPKSKLPYYILPALPPLALFMARFFVKITENPESWPRFFVHRTWLFLASTAVAGILGFNIYLFFTKEEDLLLLRTLVHGGSWIFAGGIAVSFIQHKRNLERGVFWLAGTFYASLLLVFMGMKILSVSESTFEEAKLLQNLSPAPEFTVIYSSPDRFSDLPFHLRERIIVSGPDWGTLQEQVHTMAKKDIRIRDYFWSVEDLVRRLNDKSERIVVLTQRKWFPELLKYGLKEGNYRELKRGHGKVLIANY